MEWGQTIENGLIEYIDCEETENAMIAMFVDTLQKGEVLYIVDLSLFENSAYAIGSCIV